MLSLVTQPEGQETSVMSTIDQHIAHVQERREQLLAQIPEADRARVNLAATARMHTVGGRPSDALAATVREYLQDPAAFHEHYDRDTRDYQRQSELERGYIRVGLIDLDAI
jgi:hypothetical protein